MGKTIATFVAALLTGVAISLTMAGCSPAPPTSVYPERGSITVENVECDPQVLSITIPIGGTVIFDGTEITATPVVDGVVVTFNEQNYFATQAIVNLSIPVTIPESAMGVTPLKFGNDDFGGEVTSVTFCVVR